jgi:hypothetical protein
VDKRPISGDQYTAIRDIARQVERLAQRLISAEAEGADAARIARINADLAGKQIQLAQAAESAGVPLTEATTSAGLRVPRW